MKSLTAFTLVVLQELGDRCGISTARDSETITSRIEHEGLSFLTITLSQFGKDLQKGLDRGCVTDDLFLGFARTGGLPRFLGGFLRLVFSAGTGRLLDEPSTEAIRSLHQLTQMLAKVELPCTSARVSAAFDKFIECEQDVRETDRNLSESELARFSHAFRVLFSRVLSEVDRQIYYGEIVPGHGPGATAEKLTSNGRYLMSTWTDRLERYFPAGEFLFPNWGWYHQLQDVDILEPRDELPVRVVAVPKTLKTPRVIAIEPACMMFVQQGIMASLVHELQRDDLLWGFMGIRDQEPNRALARKGSIDGSLATLDLSEASDRVSNQLVRSALSIFPHLLGGVDACRSRKADVPGHGVVRLAKFASMGSALTFPIEAMVFTTLTFLGIADALNRKVTPGLLKELQGQVRIYGDDIIVPVETMRSVIRVLEDFGLRVNLSKSFGTGRFRESCGGDYYAGERITPIRIRRSFPSSRKHADEIVSTMALRNQLFEAGYVASVNWLDTLLRSCLPVWRPVPRESSAIGPWTHEPIWADGYSPRTHEPLIKAPVLKQRVPRDPLGEHGALMKFFLKKSPLPREDEEHLLRAGRPESVDIKTRWLPLI